MNSTHLCKTARPSHRTMVRHVSPSSLFLSSPHVPIPPYSSISANSPLSLSLPTHVHSPIRNQNEVSFKTIMITRLEISRKLNIHQAKLKIHRWIHPKAGDREKAAECRIDLKQENMAPFYEKFEFWNETEHARAAAAAQRIIDTQKRAEEADRRKEGLEGEGPEGDEEWGEKGGREGMVGKASNGKGKEDDGEPDVQGGCAWWNMDALKVRHELYPSKIIEWPAIRSGPTSARLLAGMNI